VIGIDRSSAIGAGELDLVLVLQHQRHQLRAALELRVQRQRQRRRVARPHRFAQPGCGRDGLRIRAHPALHCCCELLIELERLPEALPDFREKEARRALAQHAA
jgi:hypothetical protein